MASKKIELEGKSVGRIKAGWILFKEAWVYLQHDKEMVFIPLITTIINILFFGFLLTIFFFLVLSGTLSVSSENETSTIGEYIFYFLIYLIGAFTLALSQAGVAHTVYTRVHGGNASLSESLKVAFSHWVSLLFWSAITSTVGLVLRMIAERSKLLGRIVAALFGVAWSVLTYFVVPAIVLDKKSAPAAIGHSVKVLKQTWGEAAVSNISLSIVFFLAYLFLILASMGIGIAMISANIGPAILFILLPVVVIGFVALALIQSTLESVVKTLLYIYANEGVVPSNFNPVLLQKMLKRKDGTYPQPTTAAPSTAPEQPAEPVSYTPSTMTNEHANRE